MKANIVQSWKDYSWWSKKPSLFEFFTLLAGLHIPNLKGLVCCFKGHKWEEHNYYGSKSGSCYLVCSRCGAIRFVSELY